VSRKSVFLETAFPVRQKRRYKEMPPLSQHLFWPGPKKLGPCLQALSQHPHITRVKLDLSDPPIEPGSAPARSGPLCPDVAPQLGSMDNPWTPQSASPPRMVFSTTAIPSTYRRAYISRRQRVRLLICRPQAAKPPPAHVPLQGE
jgi:hypothetical protein